MDQCLTVVEDIKANIQEVIKIQKEIFHYQDILLLSIGENGRCESMLESGGNSRPTFQLNSLKDIENKTLIFKNRLNDKSDLYQLCKTFNVHILLPINLPFKSKDRCMAVLAINSQVPLFTERQADVAKFSCNYISNLISNEHLLKDMEGYSGRMQKMLKEMVTLHEITHALESVDNLDVLLEYIMQKSQIVMEAEAASLMLVIEEDNELEFKIALGPKGQEVKPFRLPIGKGISGWVAETGKAVLIPDAYSDPRFDPSFDKRSGFVTRTMLCVPMIHQAKTVGVMTLINKLDGDPFNDNDQILFTIFASQAALAIENARLLYAAIEKERLDKELQVASEIQNLLIPQTLPEPGFLEIAAEYIPCKEVGGDFYDVIKLDENRFVFVVADVSGKGIPGALVVSNMQATLRAFLEYSNDLLPVVTKLNNAIIRQTTADRYITFFIALYDHSKTKLTYINAGHNPPLLARKSGNIKELRKGGIFIGFMPWEYEIETISFLPGDRLIMYTDGLVEAMNENEEEFELDGLKQVIKSNSAMSSIELKNEIFARINEHIGNKPLEDDFTLLITKNIV